MFWILFIALVIGTIFYLKSNEIATTEYLIYCGVVLTIGVIFVLMFNNIKPLNSEYFVSGKVIITKYYPYWVERYQMPHTICVPCGKSVSCHTYYTTEYVKHNPFWMIYDNLGQSWEVSQKVHNETKVEFKSHQIVAKEYKATHGGVFHKGDPYVYIYKNESNSYRYPTTKIEKWHNPVKNTSSLFTSKNRDKVLKYPSKTWRHGTNRLLTESTISRYDLDKLNTKLYEKCKANLIIIPVKSIKEAEKIQSQWVNGGRNDLIICIEGPLFKPTKVKVFGWSNDYYVQRALETFVITKGIKKDNLAEILNIISANFAEKDFSIYRYVSRQVPFQFWVTATAVLSVTMLLLLNTFYTNDYDKYDEENK